MLADLDLSDCTYTIRLQHGVRRSLIRVFDGFLRDQLRLIGADPDDGQLCDQDLIEGTAWELADEFIDDFQFYADDVAEATRHRPEPAADVLAGYVQENLGEFLEEFLTEPFGGWRSFLSRVTREPVYLYGVPQRPATL